MNTTQPDTAPKRGPGRPRKNDAQAVRQERRRRTDLPHSGGRLGVNPELLNHDQYAYRWINDQPGRIVAKTKHDDWDMVPQDGVKDDATDLGSMVSIVVGTLPDGSPKRAYLCRKPKTYFDEDHAEAQRKLDAQLHELQRGHTREGASQADYVPNVGISLG